MTPEDLEAARNLERFKVEERFKADLEMLNDANREMLAQQGAHGLLALRGMVILNGGAIATLLALAGAVWTEHRGDGSRLADDLTFPVYIFAAGAVTAALSAYINIGVIQTRLAGIVERRMQNRTASEAWGRKSKRLQRLSFALVAASSISFVTGVHLSLKAFSG